ncbi:MAG: hypothetical protein Q7S61_00235 [bacterium]|nr:hypothetical protein [bacterium]
MDKSLSVIFLVLLVFVGGLLIYYVVKANLLSVNPAPSNITAPINTAQTPPPILTITPTPTVFVVPFDYEIKSVSPTLIVMTGQKGDLQVPQNPIVKIFKGAPPSTEEISFTDVKVGQKARVEVIPKQKVWIYIVSN